jgi:hypothetical protein
MKTEEGLFEYRDLPEDEYQFGRIEDVATNFEIKEDNETRNAVAGGLFPVRAN